NIAMAMDAPDLGRTVETAIRALTAVSDQTRIDSVPSIAQANDDGHAIGLGQMNLHGSLARERIHYGSEGGIDFTNIYFLTSADHAIRPSQKLARARGRACVGFEDSTYASGEYFDKYTQTDWVPETERVAQLFAEAGVTIPTAADWRELKESVMEHGIYKDQKSTRLNYSHVSISYAVFCLKKK